MSTAHFTVEIGPDLTIRLPADAGFTPGPAEVTIVQAAERVRPSPPRVPLIAHKLAEVARSLQQCDLPDDLAMNHDHYIHGLPKGIDQE